MSKEVAEQYAEALSDIGQENGVEEALQDQLADFVEAFQDSEMLQKALMNPAIDLDERRNLIRSISQKAGWETYLQNFLLLLVDNHRLSIVGEINELFRQQIEKREGKLRTKVETAQPLTDDQEESIQNALARVTGKDIILETNVDESLLGGVVARLGSMVYDGSVRTKLDSLQGRILERI